MRLYGPREQYFEIHVSNNSRKEDKWIMVNYHVKNDFYEWKSRDTEDITYEEMLIIINGLRSHSEYTEKYVKDVVNECFDEYFGGIEWAYRSAVRRNIRIKDISVPKDFAYALSQTFIEPGFRIACIDKNRDVNLFRVFLMESCPFTYGDEYECFVDFYATDDELRQLAFELEMELLELPALDNW